MVKAVEFFALAREKGQTQMHCQRQGMSRSENRIKGFVKGYEFQINSRYLKVRRC